MRMASAIAWAACTAGLMALASHSAAAQDQAPRLHRRPPLRIEITPRRLQRQCVDGYTIERRAAGDTVVPLMRCWWAPR
jgi:hypothetical protein